MNIARKHIENVLKGQAKLVFESDLIEPDPFPKGYQ